MLMQALFGSRNEFPASRGCHELQQKVENSQRIKQTLFKHTGNSGWPIPVVTHVPEWGMRVFMIIYYYYVSMM
jgi:hypothetical protein